MGVTGIWEILGCVSYWDTVVARIWELLGYGSYWDV